MRHETVDDTGPGSAVGCSSTQIAAALESRWVWRATRRACQAGTSNRDDAFPEEGEAVAQVEGVGDQLRPGRRGHAEGEGERFRGERRHGRCAVAAQRLVGQQGGPAERLDPGVGGGGVEVGPVRGQLELAERGSSFGLFGFGGGFEHTGRVEVADLVLLPDRGAHGTKPSIDHRQSRPQNPLSTRGNSIVTYL